MDPYKILEIDADATYSEIKSAWLGGVSWWRPGKPLTPVYLDMMRAGIELLHLSAQPDSDWLPILVAMVETEIPDIRDTPEILPDQIDLVGTAFKRAPKTVPHTRLATAAACAEAVTLIDQLLPLDEFAVNRKLIFGVGDFDILWKPRGMTGKGCIIHASMQAIPAEQRDVWPTQPAPAYRLRISLPYWLLADSHERERLIHHELAHADRSSAAPRTHPHDIEENLETACRYGARDLAHARLMDAALRHPRTRAMLEADPDGQLNLPLAGGGLEQRGVTLTLRHGDNVVEFGSKDRSTITRALVG